jgi:hypothetical protein
VKKQEVLCRWGVEEYKRKREILAQLQNIFCTFTIA